eukprot:CAMPEP_0116144910 /NCGR_PEP_ID=MMETSP0329-20121206/16283_1 /TAXON_ID=697910 /ORGANISM="Pseudo-nitzschia arenysensis, Strain B593" /LENGTH=175 /DNA_ID=CAMNT_0003640423 /DNA_START=118 /DNA_END=645 /DNA_ORIENTATION=+
MNQGESSHNHNHNHNGNNDIGDTVDIREQYRIMAQMEANLRVKDTTGFDMDEYKEQARQIQEERAQEEERSLPQYPTKLKARLPEFQQSTRTSGSSRPEEPPLPFTRANRRYNQKGGRERVPELCQGVVVAANNGALDDDKNNIVKCWGCSVYLEFNILATLVQCPECLTISPVV